MRGGILAILFVIIVGIMLANAIANPKGTKVVIDGVTGFWSTSVNGLLANGSTGGR
jgi:type IV secretory pathway VirB2 component (pilin)